MRKHVFEVPDKAKHRTDRSKAVLLVWFSVLRVLVSVSVLFSPSLRLISDKLFSKSSCMATF